jgi:hypothetical protein
MASTNFATALQDPDNNASNLRLHQLILAKDYSSDALPSVAEDYLHAFLNTTFSHLRRRWLGIALAGMMDASPEVVEHLKAKDQPLQGLGDVILSNTEREETKIIAGFIMRQALELHVEFASFWTSDKVKNSALNFPEARHSKWMSSFQSFLDTLGDLALANPITDPCLLYPVSLVASDGFQWVATDNGMPITTIEHESLTILLPDLALRAVQFLDVPVAHIQSTTTRRAALHDSQSRTTSHTPCDLVLTLKPDSWGYRLNASIRAATELSILFQHSADAIECQSVIKEICKSSESSAISSERRAREPSTSQLNHDPSPIRSETSDLATQLPEHQAIETPHLRAQQLPQHVSSRSSPIQVSRSRYPARPRVERGQPTSGVLSRSPGEKPQAPGPSLDRREKQHSDEATQTAGHVHPMRKSQNINSTSDPAQAKTVQSQRERDSRKTKVETYVGSSRSTKVRKQPGSAQASDEPDELMNSTTAAARSQTPEHATEMSKPTTYSNGKLPKASRVVKQLASQQPRRLSDVFDIPKDNKQPKARKQATPEASSDEESTPNPKFNKVSVAPRTTRSKRRNKEDDDEFVPAKPAKKGGPKRKSISEPATQDKGSKRNIRAEPRATAAVAVTRKAPSTRVKAQQVQNGEVSNEVQPQTSGLKASGKSRLSAVVSRSSLIEGLLGSRQPSPIAQPTFKMPALPSRAPQAPSTPTQRQSSSALSAARPRTPTEQRKPPKTPVPFPSSPLSKTRAEEGHSRSRNTGDTELMSSNSKPVPASPHAESTAISGHADRDDVDLERREGDVQTAKLDPFLQRRREDQKPTSFIRRLTGDNLVTKKVVSDEGLSDEGLSQANPLMIQSSGSSDTEDTPAMTAIQPPLMPKLDDRKGSNLTVHKAAVSQLLTRRSEFQPPAIPTKADSTEIVEVLAREVEPSTVQSSQSLKRKAVTDAEGSSDGVRKRPTIWDGQKAFLQRYQKKNFLERYQKKNATPVREAEKPDTYEDDSIQSAPQQVVDDTQPEPKTENQGNFDMDGDTLINNDLNHEANDESEDPLPTHKATPVHFRSSPPPVPGTPSSHSSTSAESDSSPTLPLPPSDTEEMEWEASLQPHQRSLHDLLMRASKRVLRHVVDNETALTDIADVYENDGEHLLQEVLKRQNGACAELWQDMGVKKKRLQEDIEGSVKALVRERKRVRSIV